jgi:hypothetical protein
MRVVYGQGSGLLIFDQRELYGVPLLYFKGTAEVVWADFLCVAGGVIYPVKNDDACWVLTGN